MSGEILFSLYCFFVRNTVFRCSGTSKDMTMPEAGVLKCSTNLVQGSGGTASYCFAESGLEFGNGVLIGRSVRSLNLSISAQTDPITLYFWARCN